MRGRVLALVAALIIAPTFAPRLAHGQGGTKPTAAPSKSPTKTSPSAAPAPAAAPKYRSEIPVLTLASDDAEDQAEALSGAIRSRIRSLPNVSLDENATQHLGTFTSALACNARPDPLCLIKIGDQLKVERFIWGTLRKSSERGQVTAEVHLWRRGKPDTVATENFSDNLRDQNDDVLRRIAGRLIDRLIGQPVAAPVTIRAGDAGGEVIVDGNERAVLVRGEATVELKPGLHTLVINATGFKSETQQVEVTSTAEQLLALKLTPDEGAQPETPSKSISGRTVASLALIGVGVGFGIAGTVQGAKFLSLQSDNQHDHENLKAEDFCDPSKPHTATDTEMKSACDHRTDGEKALKLELIFYSVAAVAAGAGLIVLVTDSSREAEQPRMGALMKREKREKREPIRPRITPYVGPSAAGADFSLRF
jgi:hypothetical protein